MRPTVKDIAYRFGIKTIEGDLTITDPDFLKQQQPIAITGNLTIIFPEKSNPLGGKPRKRQRSEKKAGRMIIQERYGLKKGKPATIDQLIGAMCDFIGDAFEDMDPDERDMFFERAERSAQLIVGVRAELPDAEIEEDEPPSPRGITYVRFELNGRHIVGHVFPNGPTGVSDLDTDDPGMTHQADEVYDDVGEAVKRVVALLRSPLAPRPDSP
jgi:hypothetical protein